MKKKIIFLGLWSIVKCKMLNSNWMCFQIISIITECEEILMPLLKFETQGQNHFICLHTTFSAHIAIDCCSLGALGCAWSAFLLYSRTGLMSHSSSSRHSWKPHIKRQWFVSDWIKDQQPRSPTALSWRLCMKNTTATKRKNSVSTFLFPMHSLDKSVVELK